MAEVIVVVPCYNEAERLDLACFLDFAKRNRKMAFLFVNDGSTDQTVELINRMCKLNSKSFGWVHLPQNKGKAEAVRIGILKALEDDPVYVGMWDADLSTPLEEIPLFCKVLDQKLEVHILLGSRVKLLGRTIERMGLRHYVGRASATLISLVLGLEVYDTQCGAKMFRLTPTVKEIFQKPFKSSWIFDVELLAKFLKIRRKENPEAPERGIYELPLNKWIHKGGSKIKPLDYLRSLYELLLIWRHYL